MDFGFKTMLPLSLPQLCKSSLYHDKNLIEDVCAASRYV